MPAKKQEPTQKGNNKPSQKRSVSIQIPATDDVDPNPQPTSTKSKQVGKGGKGKENIKGKNKTKKGTGSKKAMKKAGMGVSGVKKPFRHRPGKLSLSTLETDVKIKKIPFKAGKVYSKEQLLSEVKKL